MTLMPRDRAARLGRETVAILEAGGYRTPSGNHVELRDALDDARSRTIEYRPDVPVAAVRVASHQTQFAVENSTVLDVGRRMRGDGPVAALNFASADSPGGGFLTGARAQEESIARSSGLYHCLRGREMYEYHRARMDAMYADWVVYSPDVPVFRDDAGTLLEEPWTLSVLTSPAVNGSALQRHAPERMTEVPAVMQRRTHRVLMIAAAHGATRLILGAWGCGAFGLDPEMMAATFRDALAGEFSGAFSEVVFAITDWSEDERFIGPFERAFAPMAGGPGSLPHTT